MQLFFKKWKSSLYTDTENSPRWRGGWYTLPATWDVEEGISQVRVMPGLHREFKASLGNLARPCLKKEFLSKFIYSTSFMSLSKGLAEQLLL
jgi:hypothetical protein